MAKKKSKKKTAKKKTAKTQSSKSPFKEGAWFLAPAKWPTPQVGTRYVYILKEHFVKKRSRGVYTYITIKVDDDYQLTEAKLSTNGLHTNSRPLSPLNLKKEALTWVVRNGLTPEGLVQVSLESIVATLKEELKQQRKLIREAQSFMP